MKTVKVLFVCMGNICRSPTAHGVFRKLVESEGLSDAVIIDSAGTHAYHVGKPPDERAQLTASYRDIDLSDLRARQTTLDDFEQFDYLLAMDEDNYALLEGSCPAGMGQKLHLFMSFAPDMGLREVPDPYYGGDRGFEQVFDMIEAASMGLLDAIRRDLRGVPD
ncbi:MAG: low molecular weight protein-tyrosine-phosphatase [Pseudomonadota bacterium]